MASTIESLPTMLIGAIRRGAWISPQAGRLRETARTILQGQHAGIDMTDMLATLADVALAEIANVTIRSPEIENIDGTVRPFVTGYVAFAAIEMRYGPCRTVEQVQDVARRFVADRYGQVEMDAPARRAA